MDRSTTPVPSERRWGHGPSWGAVALVLLALGVTALVAGFDSAFYAEFGGREGPERAFSCTPQEDGSCVDLTLIERQAAREPKLMSKLRSVGGELASVGLLLFVAGLASVRVAVVVRRRRVEGLTHGVRAVIDEEVVAVLVGAGVPDPLANVDDCGSADGLCRSPRPRSSQTSRRCSNVDSRSSTAERMRSGDCTRVPLSRRSARDRSSWVAPPHRPMAAYGARRASVRHSALTGQSAQICKSRNVCPGRRSASCPSITKLSSLSRHAASSCQSGWARMSRMSMQSLPHQWEWLNDKAVIRVERPEKPQIGR